MPNIFKRVRKLVGSKGSLTTIGSRLEKVIRAGTKLSDFISRSGILSPEITAVVSDMSAGLDAVAAAGRTVANLPSVASLDDVPGFLAAASSQIAKFKKGAHGANLERAGKLILGTLEPSIKEALQYWNDPPDTDMLLMRQEIVTAEEQARVVAADAVVDAQREFDENVDTAGVYSGGNFLGAVDAIEEALRYVNGLRPASFLCKDGTWARGSRRPWQIPANVSGTSIVATVNPTTANSASGNVTGGSTGTLTISTGTVVYADRNIIVPKPAITMRWGGKDKYGRTFPPDPASYLTRYQMSVASTITGSGTLQSIIGGGTATKITLLIYSKPLAGSTWKLVSEKEFSILNPFNSAALTALTVLSNFEVEATDVDMQYDVAILASTTLTSPATCTQEHVFRLVGVSAVPKSHSMSVSDVVYVDSTSQLEHISNKTRWSDLFGQIKTIDALIADLDPNKDVLTAWVKKTDQPALHTLEALFEFARQESPYIDDTVKDKLGVPNGLMDLCAVQDWLSSDGPMVNVSDVQGVIQYMQRVLITLYDTAENSSAFSSRLAKYIQSYQTA